MDHKEAVATLAAERYVLDEMSPEERHAFEDHYFGCDVCAESVEGGTVFADSTRSLGRVPNVVPIRRNAPWLARAAAAAAIAFLGVAAYEGVVLQSMRGPAIRAIEVVPVGGEMRGGAQPVAIPANKPVEVPLDITPSWGSYPSYRFELRDPHGDVKEDFSTRVAAGQVSIPLLLERLPAGSYTLAVEGVRDDGSRAAVANYPLSVK